MKQKQSGSPSGPTAGKPTPYQEWKSKDYGLGPEPPKGTWEWMQWIEDQAMIAGVAEVAERRKEKGGK